MGSHRPAFTHLHTHWLAVHWAKPLALARLLEPAISPCIFEVLKCSRGHSIWSHLSTKLHLPHREVSQTRAVSDDGYHPVFSHEVELKISEPLSILTFEAHRLLGLGARGW